MSESVILERAPIVRRGRKLEYFTIAWNTVEGLVAVIAGAFAGSISLVGFGIDSFIEVTSGAALLWRMSVDADEGVQYRCAGYLQVLRGHRMVASISRPGYPYDNASCESFMKTLKREEIYARDYRDLEHVRESVEVFIENYYNRCRLHSALGYRSPEEFENESEDLNGGASFGAATIRVFKTLTGTEN